MLIKHGAAQLPSVTIEHYNDELRDADGEFIGDRASDSAFLEIIASWREKMAEFGEDPLGEAPTEELGKRAIDRTLESGSPEAIGVLQSAIEDFSQGFTEVIRNFLKAKSWKNVERIVVGGGLSSSRTGAHVIGRAAALLKADGIATELRKIHHDGDSAGLIGAAHLVPSWALQGFEGMLAIDVGGSKIRVGIVRLGIEKDPSLKSARIWKRLVWRHCDDKPSRGTAIERLIGMLKQLYKEARREEFRLAPLIGIGCPGIIAEDGSIERGAQNLPGNWTSSRFNLPEQLRAGIPEIGDHETTILLHNDAVVQGLSEIPFTGDVKKWGIFTIGTGLGNACFSNRSAEEK